METLLTLLIFAAIVFLIVSTWCEYKLIKLEQKEANEEDEKLID